MENKEDIVRAITFGTVHQYNSGQSISQGGGSDGVYEAVGIWS